MEERYFFTESNTIAFYNYLRVVYDADNKSKKEIRKIQNEVQGYVMRHIYSFGKEGWDGVNPPSLVEYWLSHREIYKNK